MVAVELSPLAPYTYHLLARFRQPVGTKASARVPLPSLIQAIAENPCPFRLCYFLAPACLSRATRSAWPLSWAIRTARFPSQFEAGLSPATVKGCCSSVRPFLIQLVDGRRSLEAISVSDIDSLLAQKVKEEHYARVSVRDNASSLRSLVRYAEMRGWCPVGIAASILAPRVFQQESFPPDRLGILRKKSWTPLPGITPSPSAITQF
jgi:hypothetical protein